VRERSQDEVQSGNLGDRTERGCMASDFSTPLHTLRETLKASDVMLPFFSQAPGASDDHPIGALVHPEFEQSKVQSRRAGGAV